MKLYILNAKCEPEGLPSRPRNHAQPRLFVHPEKETRDFERSQVIRR